MRGSRTTTKTKGWLFSALGAWVAAVRIRATVSSSTSSGRNDRAARWVCTTSKKSGTGQSGPLAAIRYLARRPMVPSRWTWCPAPPAGLGGAEATRYLWRCIGPGPVPAMTTWSGTTAEGDRRQTVADGAASQEDVLKGIIGQPTGKSKVVVERGPVQHFADAVLSTSPIYHSPEAARQAGFDNIPAPPTWPFAMEFSGKFEEIQPADAPHGQPAHDAIGPLMAKGGLILHGEQEFLYHRPVQVGDVLVSEGKITDAYQKESKGRTMTFIVHGDQLERREDRRAGRDGALQPDPPGLGPVDDAPVAPCRAARRQRQRERAIDGRSRRWVRRNCPSRTCRWGTRRR